MGVGPKLGGWSGPSYETTNKPVVIMPPNPNPKNFHIRRTSYIGVYLVIEIHYPDCTNYEGNKILVYEDVSFCKLFIWNRYQIDPHFCDDPNYISPIARFVPTDEGWKMALRFAEMMAQLNT
jgi:hypothetical protein